MHLYRGLLSLKTRLSSRNRQAPIKSNEFAVKFTWFAVIRYMFKVFKGVSADIKGACWRCVHRTRLVDVGPENTLCSKPNWSLPTAPLFLEADCSYAGISKQALMARIS